MRRPSLQKLLSFFLILAAVVCIFSGTFNTKHPRSLPSIGTNAYHRPQTADAHRFTLKNKRLAHIDRRSFVRKMLKSLEDNELESDIDDGNGTKLSDEVDLLLDNFTFRLCRHCAPPSDLPSDTASLPYKLGYQVRVLEDAFLADNASYFRPRSWRINGDAEFTLHNASLCSLPGGQRPYVLALIPTVKGHRDTRDAIRQTWGSASYNHGFWGHMKMSDTLRLLFVLGSDGYSREDRDWLEEEAHQHGDLLLSEFVDSYRNLSLKIAMGLTWVDQYCQGVGHVVKVDEDTFLNMPRLIHLLKFVESKYSSFVLGHKHYLRQPPVVRTGRWQVGPEYPLPKFPKYVYGHSYVVSGPAVASIVRTFRHMPLVTNEDAYVTGILSKAANVTRLDFPLFAFYSRRSLICRIAYGQFVSVTGMCDEHLVAVYDDVKKGFCDWRMQTDLNGPKCRFRK